MLQENVSTQQIAAKPLPHLLGADKVNSHKPSAKAAKKPHAQKPHQTKSVGAPTGVNYEEEHNHVLRSKNAPQQAAHDAMSMCPSGYAGGDTLTARILNSLRVANASQPPLPPPGLQVEGEHAVDIKSQSAQPQRKLPAWLAQKTSVPAAVIEDEPAKKNIAYRSALRAKGEEALATLEGSGGHSALDIGRDDTGANLKLKELRARGKNVLSGVSKSYPHGAAAQAFAANPFAELPPQHHFGRFPPHHFWTGAQWHDGRMAAIDSQTQFTPSKDPQVTLDASCRVPPEYAQQACGYSAISAVSAEASESTEMDLNSNRDSDEGSIESSTLSSGMPMKIEVPSWLSA
jgi:hypothetical protein